MEKARIEDERRRVVERFGPWTAHNLRLADDVYTIGEGVAGDEIKLRRVLRSVADIAGRPLDTLRILDLACLEGLYAVEFARHGAQVIGIEGRLPSIEKARFAAEVLGLPNLAFVHDDVRNLRRAKYGEFDVVLCLGILYHLDVPDMFTFLEQMAEVCRGFVVVDTHVATTAERTCVYRGRTYRGRTFAEHDPASTPEDRAADLWSSLDNVDSFWPTRTSLFNALAHAGFTSVYECAMPPEADKPADRVTLIAVKGAAQELLCAPLLAAQPVADLPE